MHIDLGDSLQLASQKDWKRVADITAEAFAKDPVMRWVFGTPRAVQSSLRVLSRSIYTKRGICHLLDDKGAAMWISSDQIDDPPTFALLQILTGAVVHGSVSAISRAMTAGDMMAKHHPEEPHLYLFTIGARASARGQGVGKALLRPVLEHCDSIGMPVYLENSNPVNTGFYVSHGFEPRETFDFGAGTPIMGPMWREPKKL